MMIPPRTILIFLTCVLMPVAVAAGEVRALVALAFRPATDQIATDFEKATGHKVTPVFGTAGALSDKVKAGEDADVVLVPQAFLDPLRAERRVVAGTEVPVAMSLISIGVRAGAAKPDISTPDALKRALLAAHGVAHPDPRDGGAVGIHAARVIEKLEIAGQLKARVTPPNALVALLASGEVELAFLQPAVALADPRIELVGPLPMELQDRAGSLFLAAVTANARDPDAARAFVQYLASPAAAKVIKARGMEPQAKP